MGQINIEMTQGSMFAEVRGAGAPVLILHGGGLDHRHMLDALEPTFDETKGWERIYLDLPGHGRSNVDETVCSQDDVLSMISEFADKVFGDQQFAVIGESRGTYHAMGLVHTRPADILGMMLIVADGIGEQTVDWRPEHQTLVSASADDSASPETLARYARLVRQTPEILEKIEKSKTPTAKMIDYKLAGRLRDNFTFSFDLRMAPTSFDKPSLIMNGRQDAMAGYQDMIEGIERYPRATLVILDCAGHSLAWEQPALFKAHTLDWLVRMTQVEPPAI